MNSNKFFLLFIIYLLFSFELTGQISYVFKHIDVTKGLPDNQGRGFFFSPDGRVGIRTSVSLNLYDGSHFVSYPYSSRNLYRYAQEDISQHNYLDKYDRVWIKERGVIHVFDLQTERYISNVDSLLRTFDIASKLNNMFIDSNNRYWFETIEGSTLCYNTDNDSLYTIHNEDEFIERYGKLIAVDSFANYCWMVYEKGLIRCWDIDSRKFVHREERFLGLIRPGDRSSISILSNRDFWLMWDRGLAYYDNHQQLWTMINTIQVKDSDLLTVIDTDSDGNAWVGSSQSGIFIVNRRNLVVQNLNPIHLFGGGNVSNDVTDIAIDPNNGGIWVSFLNQAVVYYHSGMNKFLLLNNKTVDGVPFDENVRCMLEMDDGKILIGTGKGLFRYDPKTNQMDIPYPELVDKLCNYLYRDKSERIWVATYHSGLFCLDRKKVRRYYDPALNYQSIPNYYNIRNIQEDEHGNFWVLINRGGLSTFDPQNGTFQLISERFPNLQYYQTAVSFIEDGTGQFIISSSNGLYYYSPKDDFIWIPELDAPNDKRFMHMNNKYNCVFRDSRGLIWFGTQNGLDVVDMKNDTSQELNKEDGLNNSYIQSILEDDNKDIWVSTSNGLCKIQVNSENDHYNFNIISFNQDDGLQSGEYNTLSSLKTSDGTIYFGGANGINVFRTENIIYEKINNSPVFTSFQLFNKSIIPGEVYHGKVILNKGISYTEQITLRHDENFFTLEFAGLNFINPSQTYYRYFLEGFDNRWTEIRPSDGLGGASYTGLPPGKYTFRVYTANNDKLWGENVAEIQIQILPPFWNTVWAWIIYSACVIALMIYSIVYLNKKSKEKTIRAKQIEVQRQKEELDQMKYRFFTNISHEFRTPLTLIITPLEAYIYKMKDDVGKKQLLTVHRNALSLLSLVNQLLDFRKLEMKGEKLNLLHGEFTEFLEQIYQSFQTVAIERNIKFSLECSSEPIYMCFDRDKVSKIINNLLSNAFKFTPDGGIVLLSLWKEWVESEDIFMLRIDVIDNGVGISKEDVAHIFDRFYQVQKQNDEKAGSGIGLHLVKEYTELHNGKITVKSNQGEGAEFTIYLPLDLSIDQNERPNQLTEELQMETEEIKEAEETKNKPTVLLVEDNLEFRTFLKDELKEWYNVVEARDGEVGEEMAISHDLDLIVSDIMMPKVDGIEFCKRVKNNIQTSHIPIILLTARSSDDSKAMGYDAGADSYISKPFNFDMLLIRIRKLIEQREKRKELFQKNIEVTPSSITITSLDEKLVQRALECVEKNMDNVEYSVEELSSDVGMHRMHLYRKLQSITGKTPTEFIRTIRLKRAAQLLKESQFSISEISDMVGFSSPKYFRKVFKDEFNVSPSHYKPQ